MYFNDLQQLIMVPPHITCNSSTIFRYFLFLLPRRSYSTRCYWCRIVGPLAQFFCIWIISRFRWETYDYINQFVLKAQLLYLRKTSESAREKNWLRSAHSRTFWLNCLSTLSQALIFQLSKLIGATLWLIR